MRHGQPVALHHLVAHLDAQPVGAAARLHADHAVLIVQVEAEAPVLAHHGHRAPPLLARPAQRERRARIAARRRRRHDACGDPARRGGLGAEWLRQGRNERVWHEPGELLPRRRRLREDLRSRGPPLAAALQLDEEQAFGPLLDHLAWDQAARGSEHAEAGLVAQPQPIDGHERRRTTAALAAAHELHQRAARAVVRLEQLALHRRALAILDYDMRTGNEHRRIVRLDARRELPAAHPHICRA